MVQLLIVGSTVLILVLGLSLRYIVDRRELGSETARKQLPLVGRAWGGALLITMLVTLFLIGRGLRSWLTISYALFALVIVGLLGAMIWRRRHAGRPLLDLGRLPRQKFLLIAGGFMALGELTLMLIHLVTAEPISVNSAILLFQIVLAAYFIYMGLAHQEIRDDGIVYQGTLIPWRRIVSYRWDEQRDRLLMLTIKGGWPRPRSCTVHLPIMSVSRAEVDQTLAQYLGS